MRMGERAICLVSGIEEEAGSITAACRRVGEVLGINSDTLRLDEAGPDRCREAARERALRAPPISSVKSSASLAKGSGYLSSTASPVTPATEGAARAARHPVPPGIHPA